MGARASDVPIPPHGWVDCATPAGVRRLPRISGPRNGARVTASATLDGGPAARTERSFPALDGMRVIAATAVVLTHAGFWTSPGVFTPADRAIARLDVGVA